MSSETHSDLDLDSIDGGNRSSGNGQSAAAMFWPDNGSKTLSANYGLDIMSKTTSEKHASTDHNFSGSYLPEEIDSGGQMTSLLLPSAMMQSNYFLGTDIDTNYIQTTLRDFEETSNRGYSINQLAERINDQARANAEAKGSLDNAGSYDMEVDAEADADNGYVPTGDEQTGRWTAEEHELFLQALKKFGKEWKKVANMVKTRTVVQTRTHAQKYFQKLQKTGLGPEDFEAGIDYNLAATLTSSASKSGSAKKSRRRVENHPSGASYVDQSGFAGGAVGSLLGEDEDDLDFLDDSVGTFGLVALHNAAGDLSPLNNPKRNTVQFDDQVPPSATPVRSNDDLVGIATSNQRPPQYASTSKASIGYGPNSTGKTSVQNKNRTPLPSPAACGKRKVDELSAARMMAGARAAGENTAEKTGDMEKPRGSAEYRRRVNSIDQPTPHDPKLKLSFDASINKTPSNDKSSWRNALPITDVSLSIVNPSDLRPLSPYIRRSDDQGDSSPPGTPWEGELRDLEARQRQQESFKINLSTPKQFKNFAMELKQCIGTCDDRALIDLLSAAEKSVSIVGTPMSLATVLEDTASESKVVHFESVNDSSNGASSNVQPTLSSLLNLPFSGSSETPLLYACSLDPNQYSVEHILIICKTLIEHGSSTLVTDSKGSTGLHRAAQSGLRELGKLLINKGCSINAVDSDGNTALHVASGFAQTSFIELLSSFGANCHTRNIQSRSAIDIAATFLPNLSEVEYVKLRSQIRELMMNREPRHRTLVLYHEDCSKHIARSTLDWEGPDRLDGIMNAIRDQSIFKACELKITNEFEKADVELLQRVHSPEYIAFVNSLSKQLQNSDTTDKNDIGTTVPFTPQVQRQMLGHSSSDTKPSEYCDTSFSAGTLSAARRAAGAVAHAVDSVLLGRNRNAFCVVRPPGHHAGYRGLLDGAKSCGFCIFNNVAAGALHALEGHICDRVAVIDIDVHHGNGTEDIVRRYNRPDKLFFFSSHLFDREESYEFFPGSGASDDMAFNIINVPILPMWTNKSYNPQGIATGTRSKVHSSSLPSPTEPHSVNFSPAQTLHSTSGREAFRQAISLRLLPALRAFNPNLILLSTGFDGIIGDVGNSRNGESGMDLKIEDFEWATTEILKVADICCNGRVVSVLEGGYGSRRPPSVQGSSTKKLNKDLVADSQSLDRKILASAAIAHVHRLIDPYQ